MGRVGCVWHERPEPHTLSVDGRAADNPRLVARDRASGQGWRQNKFEEDWIA